MPERQRQHHRPPHLIERARKLRREMTGPERALWGVLRNAQVAKLKFRRQQPFGPYTLDFYCAEKSLCVEVDGETHIGTQAIADERRTAYLNQHGVGVLRFTNDEVLQSLEAVTNTIAREVGASWWLDATPHPSPLPQGERGEVPP